MFTGIIEGQGTVKSIDWPVLTIQLPFPVPPIGASVAVNGVCLTVVQQKGKSMVVDVMEETLSITNLGDLKPSQGVNLERAMKANATLDGHLVQGHVEGTAVLKKIEPRENSHLLWFQAPSKFTPMLVDKGSITLDGISLTVVKAKPGGLFSVSIIPHTWEVTNLKHLNLGDRVNIETDLVARMIHRQIGPYLKALTRSITKDQKDSGSSKGSKRMPKA